MTEDTTYNGWTNRETWCVGMYMDGNYDGEGTCRFFERMIAAFDGYTRSTSEVVSQLEGELKNAVEYAIYGAESDSDGDKLLSTGIIGDLLGGALANVNWREIAQTRLADRASEVSSA